PTIPAEIPPDPHSVLCFRLGNDQRRDWASLGSICPSFWTATGTRLCRHISRRTHDAFAQSGVPAGVRPDHSPAQSSGRAYRSHTWQVRTTQWSALTLHKTQPQPELFCKLQTF
ncbi:unnamed protein product, partial [Gulo gulo]